MSEFGVRTRLNRLLMQRDIGVHRQLGGVRMAMFGWPRRVAMLLIRGYRAAVSPLLGPCCRFSPSCSEYAHACMRDHGLIRGGWLSIRRLLRCHPWHPGGIDLPPPLSIGSRSL